MKKITVVIIGLLLLLQGSLRADEGMWLLPLIQKLNMDTMTAMGLKLSADDIYSINHGCLKDAVVIFANYCTGEIVSEDGLLFTNHHCGYDAIQDHSTVEHNYLEDGFWAKNHDEELTNPGLTVTFLISMEDVTSVIIASLNDSMSEESRDQKITQLSDSITEAATKGTDYKASVESFFGGNNYYLFIYEVYKDVRLVGAPPSSIGKFGYDTDNWMWPRQTGDFSIFRVYTGPDGKPAEYSPNNIPLKPKHFLPISLKGYKNGDFTMVIGYPGSTDRYMTSFEVKELLDITNPNRIKIRGLRQNILIKDMQADEAVNIKYSSKYSQSSNYWKYSIGQNEGLRHLKVFDQKQELEKNFTDWVKQDPIREKKYGQALGLIQNAVEGRALYENALQYSYECFFSAAEIIGFAYRANILYGILSNDPENKKLIDSIAFVLKKRGDDFFKDYNAPTDIKVTAAILKLFYDNVPDQFHPRFYDIIQSKYHGNYDKYIQNMFGKSIFDNQQRFNKFIEHPTLKVLQKDPAFQATLSALNMYREIYSKRVTYDENYEKGHRLYIEGLMEMQKDKTFYSDANFTMRLTYGSVKDYYPRDAVHYDYFTSLKGVMEKEDPSNWEFIVSDKLKQLYKNKDYGPYGQDSIMHVCFITTNDITGGNSGSPIIDGEGNLLGLAFDGNWEAMSGDIIYEPSIQRCIGVDIRYVLFIIDKYAGDSNLIKELKIVQ